MPESDYIYRFVCAVTSPTYLCGIVFATRPHGRYEEISPL
jgi:hypothetical protein